MLFGVRSRKSRLKSRREYLKFIEPIILNLALNQVQGLTISGSHSIEKRDAEPSSEAWQQGF